LKRPPAAAAVTYHRVSTRDQDPTLARRELRAAARARGLRLVDQVEETGSGARNDRPGLRRVLELVNAGAVAYVLVWKLDRFGRSTLDVLANVKALNEAGATLVATTQGLEVGPRSSAMGRVVLTVLAAVAELERETISERTLLGLEAARRRGRLIGRPKGSRDTYKRKRRRAA
jgi:DNA invertase Pin-like site-specific DNA recombinase